MLTHRRRHSLRRAKELYWQNEKGENTTLRGNWVYKWQSTAAYGGKNRKGEFSGTTFMKVTDEYKKATGNKGQ